MMKVFRLATANRFNTVVIRSNSCVAILEGKQAKFLENEDSRITSAVASKTVKGYFGTTSPNVVIMVPAYFNDSHRQATKVVSQFDGFHGLKVRVIVQSTRFNSNFGSNDKKDEDTTKVSFSLKELLLAIDLKIEKLSSKVEKLSSKVSEIDKNLSSKVSDLSIKVAKLDTGMFWSATVLSTLSAVIICLVSYLLTTGGNHSVSASGIVKEQQGDSSRDQVLTADAINLAESVLHDTESKIAEIANQLNENELRDVKECCETLKKKLGDRDRLNLAELRDAVSVLQQKLGVATYRTLTNQGKHY